MKYIKYLFLISLSIPTAYAVVPNYFSVVAEHNNVELEALLKQRPSVIANEPWPWIIWSDETPIKIKDQVTLIKYLSNDPSAEFGQFKLNLSDFSEDISLAIVTQPVFQANYVASTIAPPKLQLIQTTSTPIHSDYQTLVEINAAKFGVPANLINSVIKAESNFNRTAVSHKGARGLMQVMPQTAKGMGYDPNDLYDPSIAIEAGTRYLSQQLNEFQDVGLALAAYNAGPNAVKKYGYSVPPYRETINYVDKVLAYYQGER